MNNQIHLILFGLCVLVSVVLLSRLFGKWFDKDSATSMAMPVSLTLNMFLFAIFFPLRQYAPSLPEEQFAEDQVTLSPEEQLAKERALLEEEKRRREAEAARVLAEAQEALAEAREREAQEAERKKREAQEAKERQRREAQLAKERRAREIKEAQVRDEIARLRAERNKLREEAIPREVAAKIAEVNKQLEELKATAPDPSELKAMNARNGEMSNASPATPQAPGAPLGDQTRLVLSGLWLGACFFLQRVFEKLFKDKGYALLTVCAAGFLLAFFTANYFLLGGSVTGGLMGSVGERS